MEKEPVISKWAAAGRRSVLDFRFPKRVYRFFSHVAPAEHGRGMKDLNIHLSHCHSTTLCIDGNGENLESKLIHRLSTAQRTHGPGVDARQVRSEAESFFSSAARTNETCSSTSSLRSVPSDLR